MSPGTRNTAEKQRACVAVYVVCRLAPRRPPRSGGCVSPCAVLDSEKGVCRLVCVRVHNWKLLYRKLERSSRLQED